MGSRKQLFPRSVRSLLGGVRSCPLGTRHYMNILEDVPSGFLWFSIFRYHPELGSRSHDLNLIKIDDLKESLRILGIIDHFDILKNQKSSSSKTVEIIDHRDISTQNIKYGLMLHKRRSKRHKTTQSWENTENPWFLSKIDERAGHGSFKEWTRQGSKSVIGFQIRSLSWNGTLEADKRNLRPQGYPQSITDQ